MMTPDTQVDHSSHHILPLKAERFAHSVTCSGIMEVVSIYLLLCTVLSVTALVPKPFNTTLENDVFIISDRLELHHEYSKCNILYEAGRRLTDRLRLRHTSTDNLGEPIGMITSVHISIVKGCDESKGIIWPYESMNEDYCMLVADNEIILEAEEIWGALHGLETIAQLVHRSHTQTVIKICAVASIFAASNPSSVYRRQTTLSSPRFPYRYIEALSGLTAYFPVCGMFCPTHLSVYLRSIFSNKDAMAMVKMNLLHWRIVDNSSFPYSSYTFPELARKGAYDPEAYVYTQDDVKRVLDYCRLRGIRVMPEFATPVNSDFLLFHFAAFPLKGYAYSWGKGYPDLLTKCYSDGKPNGRLGPVNPITDYTYNFMQQFVHEIKTVFKDPLVHLGGDAADFSCWASNPEIEEFMQKMEFGKDYSKLQRYYLEKLNDYLAGNNNVSEKTAVFRQGPMDYDSKPGNKIVIHVWKNEIWQQEMFRITKAGFPVILSSNWYLNMIEYGVDWPRFYNLDPSDFGGELRLW
ncbi:hexosaminidase [Paragonimus westermani]|uniref:Beta-hexosaminidase n=1 Tax=Paragonimus westermani TaxID=34504 RepID=A0A5J4NTT0_9TREM|nr:hexosaminidase [Paragonimus westermani]